MKFEDMINTIINDDCLNILKDIPDGSIDAIITDPPYLYLKNQKLERPFDEEKFFNEAKRVLKDTGFIVLFGRGTSFYRWNTILARLDFEFKEELIWNKRRVSTIFNAIARIHETISIHCKGKGTINVCKVPYIEMRKYDTKAIVDDIKRILSTINNPQNLKELMKYIETGNLDFNKDIESKHHTSLGKAKTYNRNIRTYRMIENGLQEKSIIEIQGEHYKMQHPTQKPIELLKRIIPLVTAENDIVLDCFSGSGTTCVAAKELGRRFIGIEIDPEYHKISLDRLNGILANGQISFDTDISKL